MNCTYCDTELPVGALFCGECGRAVAPDVAAKSDAAPAPRMSAPRTSAPVLSAPAAPAVAPGPELIDFGERCEQCGAELGEDDIFCGECGYVTRSASSHFSHPRDTVVIEAAQLERDAQAAVPAMRPPAAHDPAPRDPVPHYPASGPPPTGTLEPHRRWDDDLDDVAATRIVADHRRPGIRFVLQFSTGESFTVYGNGLIGRNPKPEPAEYFDHLVRVLDPSRSVSKTHIEFGQEAGAFWVKDRFSGNGSTIREPEGDPVRCQPDRRYRVTRGTRVEIGEQFFIVS